MATKRLIDANAFWNLLQQVVYDIFTVHEQDGKLTGTASVGYYTETIREVLKQTPTVDAVEVVHGHWVSLTECANAGVYCSVCNKKVYKEDYAWCNRKNKLRSNYCPNCGAKMDGGNEDG